MTERSFALAKYNIPLRNADFSQRAVEVTEELEWLKEVEKKRDFFFKQANLRNLEHPQTLWEEYKKRIGA